MPVVLVCGPPCSGKSTYVNERITEHDRVICLDTIAHHQLGSPTRWMHNEQHLRAADDIARTAIADVHPTDEGTTYIIRSLPRATDRNDLATKLNAEVVLLDPGERECVARAKRDGRPSGTTKAIRLWYWAANNDPQP